MKHRTNISILSYLLIIIYGKIYSVRISLPMPLLQAGIAQSV
jgi:hypothetical protein